jgi:hypothetical protein
MSLAYSNLGISPCAITPPKAALDLRCLIVSNSTWLAPGIRLPNVTGHCITAQISYPKI